MIIQSENKKRNSIWEWVLIKGPSLGVTNRLLMQEICFVPIGYQTFFNEDVEVDLVPLTVMTHVRKIGPLVSHICQSFETEFECGRRRMRAGGDAIGAKVEITLVPRGPNIDYIIHFRFCG